METPMIIKAKELATMKHDCPSESQRYGSKPYSVHLQMVVDVAQKYLHLLDESVREDVITACWCHDCVEDTELSPNDLKKLFNERVADIVYRVSNERGLSRREILFKTLPKIWENPLAIYVKLSDRISNGTNSKNGQSDKSKHMYAVYTEQYPIFRYALKKDGLYSEMWTELDSIFNYKLSF